MLRSEWSNRSDSKKINFGKTEDKLTKPKSSLVKETGRVNTSKKDKLHKGSFWNTNEGINTDFYNKFRLLAITL